MTKNETGEGSAAQGGANGSSSSSGRAGWLLLGGAALLAAGSIGVNVFSGADDSETEVEAQVDAGPSIEELRDAAEASSDDAEPWDALGFEHYQRREFAEAVAAYERAVEIDPNSAVLWAALGETRAMALDQAQAAANPLPSDAVAAFERALELDPQEPRARYYMAVRKDLDGDAEGAISDWLALLADSPPGAPWESDVVRTIQQVGAINDIAVEDRLSTVMSTRTPQVVLPGSGDAAGAAASPALRGPSAQQVAEASRLPPTEQRSMAEGMVAGLEARLQSDPNDFDGWVMLMRSRVQLGQPDEARAALENAVAALPARAGELRAAARQVGVQ